MGGGVSSSPGILTKNKRSGWSVAALLAAFLAVVLLSFCFGRYRVGPFTVVKALASHFLPIARTWDPTVDTVVWQVRFPRILAASLVGACLAVGGAVFQGLFHNPLVSPYALGVSSGASLGAAVAILLGAAPIIIETSAFASGALAVTLTWLVAQSSRDRSQTTLVLAGIVVGSLFASLVSGTQYIADPNTKLPQIVFWIMGSLASVQWTDIFRAALIAVPCMMVLVLLRWKINILSMGDEEAAALGEDPRVMRFVLVAVTTLMTASTVSLAGVIGWVGLVVPHIARNLFGPDYRRLLPASIILGALYMLIIDDLARTITMAEIPLGILTGIVGAPVFALLLRRNWKR